MRVLGIDPGKQTGLALVDVGSQAPFLIERLGTLHDEPPTALTKLGWLDVAERIVVEWFEFQGADRASGIGPQAAAAGLFVGYCLGLGHAVVAIPRTDILRGLGLPPNTAKDHARQAAVSLTRGAIPTNMHTADAVAAAVAGAGYPPTYTP